MSRGPRLGFREDYSLLKNPIQVRAWLPRPAPEAPNRALGSRNRRFWPGSGTVSSNRTFFNRLTPSRKMPLLAVLGNGAVWLTDASLGGG
jgi:hypothetical protein